MIQNVQIEVEQFDNGITVRWEDLDGATDDENKVVLEGAEAKGIGSMIWEDIKAVMDEEVKNRVKLTIKYEAI